MHRGSFLEWATMFGEWGIVLTIAIEGCIALREYRSAKIFDTIKYLEEWETRAARRLLFEKLPLSGAWWDRNQELADAAADVCARYGLVAAVTEHDRSVRTFVARHWAHNICRFYVLLESYVRYREAKTPGVYRHYTALYSEARKYK